MSTWADITKNDDPFVLFYATHLNAKVIAAVLQVLQHHLGRDLSPRSRPRPHAFDHSINVSNKPSSVELAEVLLEVE
ncbi:hypothetical protein HDU96_004120, partial [Phlyctochytrium bullatum]